MAVDAGADMIGLIVAESPRRIDSKRAAEIAAEFMGQVEPVLIVQNQRLEHVKDMIFETGVRWVQLHGEEDDEYAVRLGVNLIRAFAPNKVPIRDPLRFYRAFLVDLPKDDKPADPEAYRTAYRRLSALGDTFLSGALTPENVGEWIHELRPFGVDVCRATERVPGRKDPAKIRDFIQAVRAAETT